MLRSEELLELVKAETVELEDVGWDRVGVAAAATKLLQENKVLGVALSSFILFSNPFQVKPGMKGRKHVLMLQLPPAWEVPLETGLEVLGGLSAAIGLMNKGCEWVFFLGDPAGLEKFSYAAEGVRRMASRLGIPRVRGLGELADDVNGILSGREGFEVFRRLMEVIGSVSSDNLAQLYSRVRPSVRTSLISYTLVSALEEVIGEAMRKLVKFAREKGSRFAWVSTTPSIPILALRTVTPLLSDLEVLKEVWRDKGGVGIYVGEVPLGSAGLDKGVWQGSAWYVKPGKKSAPLLLVCFPPSRGRGEEASCILASIDKRKHVLELLYLLRRSARKPLSERA